MATSFNLLFPLIDRIHQDSQRILNGIAVTLHLLILCLDHLSDS